MDDKKKRLEKEIAQLKEFITFLDQRVQKRKASKRHGKRNDSI